MAKVIIKNLEINWNGSQARIQGEITENTMQHAELKKALASILQSFTGRSDDMNNPIGTIIIENNQITSWDQA